MTPQAANYLEKARKLLADADRMLNVGLSDAAGRAAYLAGFHVAQAFIFERLGKVYKTQKGVQTEFLRLTKSEPDVDSELRSFLVHAYNLKAIADYETGPGAEISAELAAPAVQNAKRFAIHFSRLITPT